MTTSSIGLMQLKQISSSELLLVWNDGRRDTISLQVLRDGCPCAGCQGETVLFHSYEPPAPNLAAPGRYTLKGAETVGEYAMKFSWGDGHETGIYTWEHLRALGVGPSRTMLNRHGKE